MNNGKKVMLMTLALCCLNGTVLAQKINRIKVMNQSVKTAMTEFNKKTGYSFVYVSGDVNMGKIVKVDTDDLQEAVRQIFNGQGLSFEIEGKNIILSKQNPQKQNGIRRKITGEVKDNNGEPIIGASVVEKGTTNGTITDMDGKFVLNVEGGASLDISFVGYVTNHLKIGSKDFYEVSLSENTKLLDEVVVVGYGSVKKTNLTGAVSSVKMDEVPKTSSTDVSNLLIGRVSGLSIRQNSATPEGGYSMVIRGSASTNADNSPLYVVDGFPGGDINAINPNDIASVEVLKDASSTSIYGARAANGVILITTKKGSKDKKVNVNFKSSFSAQVMANPYELMDAKEYMSMANDFYVEDWMYNNKIAPYGNNTAATVSSKPKVAFSADEIANATNVTDWFKEITQTGLIDNEALSISGGSENSRYLASLGHFNQRGVVKKSGIEKFMGRLSLETDLSKWLTTGISISGNVSTNDQLRVAASDSQHGVISDALLYPKYLPIKDEEGNYVINPDHSNKPNPVSWQDVTNRTRSNRYLINNFWNAKLGTNLVFRMSWGVNSNFTRLDTYYPKTMLIGHDANSEAFIRETRRNDYLLDGTLTYSRELWKNHSLKAMLGYAYQKFSQEQVSAGNSDFLTDVFGVHNLAAGGDLTKTVGSYKAVTKYLSYFGRINYDIADKYLFTFTLRADGSDRFGKNNKFGYFPSGAFAWRITEEPFMKQQNILSNLKLRLSLGQTGNAEIGGNTYGYYGTGYNYVFGNTIVSGVAEKQLQNANLKWETSTEWNFGLDFGVFKDRITGSFEFFRKVVSDLLDKRNVGSYYPVSEVADNLGSTLTTGMEFQLHTVNMRHKDFEWTTDFNISSYRDRWKTRNPYTILSVYNSATDPLHVTWGYLSDGIIQIGEKVPHMSDAAPGSIKIRDIRGWKKDASGNYVLDENGHKMLSDEPDGSIDDADKVIICHNTPDFSFGMGNTLRYKNWDLNFFLYGEVGRQLYNNTRSQFLKAERFRFADNVLVDARDRWSTKNPQGKYPSGLYTKYYNDSDFWVENADFLRLKMISIGYQVPIKRLKNIFSSVRLFVEADNLFCITNYTGADPETDNNYSSYPNQKTFTFGFDIHF